MGTKFLGLKVSKVGSLLTKIPNELLDQKHNIKLPGIVRLSLVKVSYLESHKIIPTPYLNHLAVQQRFNSYCSHNCTCTIIHTSEQLWTMMPTKRGKYIQSVTTTDNGKIISKKKTTNFTDNEDIYCRYSDDRCRSSSYIYPWQ